MQKGSRPDDVAIDAPGSYTPTHWSTHIVPSSSVAKSPLIAYCQETATIALESARITGGLIEAIAGGKIDVASGLDAIHGATVTADANSSLSVENGATLQLDNETSFAGGTIANQGAIEILSGTVTIDGVVIGDGLTKIDAGATLKLDGSTIGTPTVNNNGIIESHSEVASVLTGVVTGTGVIHIDSGASLELSGSSPINDQILTFEGSTGTLKLDNAQVFHATIAGFTGNGQFSGSDHIDLVNINLNSVHFTETMNTAADELTVSDGLNTADLRFTDFAGSFAFVGDGSNGTIIYDPPLPATYDVAAADNKAGSVYDRNVIGLANQILKNDASGMSFNFKFNESVREGADHVLLDYKLEAHSSFAAGNAKIIDLVDQDGHAGTFANSSEHPEFLHSWAQKPALGSGDFHLT